MNVEVIEASQQDQSVIQNLGRHYVYEMSRFCGHRPGWEVPSDGLYECRDLSSYWKIPGMAFFIKVDDELAGFALINKGGSDPHVEWDLGEFFVMAKFQGRGVGKSAAEQIFDRFPGVWEVRQMPENHSACVFWERVIRHYTRGQFSCEEKIIPSADPDPMVVLQFRSLGREEQA